MILATTIKPTISLVLSTQEINFWENKSKEVKKIEFSKFYYSNDARCAGVLMVLKTGNFAPDRLIPENIEPGELQNWCREVFMEGQKSNVLIIADYSSGPIIEHSFKIIETHGLNVPYLPLTHMPCPRRRETFQKFLTQN